MLPGQADLLVPQVVGAVGLVLAVALGAGRLRRHLGPRPSHWLAVSLALVASLWLVPGYALDGHAAEVAVPFMWLAAGLLVLAGRPVLAAALIGLSCGWEMWGLLGLPILLLRQVRPTPLLLAAGVAAGVAGLLYLPFIATGSFAMGHHTWHVGSGTLAGIVLGEGTAFSWWMRITQGAASLTAGAVTALLARGAPAGIWLTPLAAISTRFLLDPLAYHYYDVVPQLLGLAGIALLSSESARWRAAAVVLAYLPFAYTEESRPWGLALSLLLGAALARGLRPRASASARGAGPAVR